MYIPSCFPDILYSFHSLSLSLKGKEEGKEGGKEGEREGRREGGRKEGKREGGRIEGAQKKLFPSSHYEASVFNKPNTAKTHLGMFV